MATYTSNPPSKPASISSATAEVSAATPTNTARVPRPQRQRIRSMLDDFEFYETGEFKNVRNASSASSFNNSSAAGSLYSAKGLGNNRNASRSSLVSTGSNGSSSSRLIAVPKVVSSASSVNGNGVKDKVQDAISENIDTNGVKKEPNGLGNVSIQKSDQTKPIDVKNNFAEPLVVKKTRPENSSYLEQVDELTSKTVPEQGKLVEELKQAKVDNDGSENKGAAEKSAANLATTTTSSSSPVINTIPVHNSSSMSPATTVATASTQVPDTIATKGFATKNAPAAKPTKPTKSAKPVQDKAQEASLEAESSSPSESLEKAKTGTDAEEIDTVNTNPLDKAIGSYLEVLEEYEAAKSSASESFSNGYLEFGLANSRSRSALDRYSIDERISEGVPDLTVM